MKIHVWFERSDKLSGYIYPNEWITQVTDKDLRMKMWFTSVTKPTQRQLRQWKKCAKQAKQHE